MSSLSGEAVSGTAVSVSDHWDYALLISFSDADDISPAWVDVTPDLRSYSVGRGRGDERQEIDAGTASFVLNNRDGDYDPNNTSSPHYPNIRPMNRVWLRAQYAGQTYNLFKGWTDGMPQTWPGIVDAVVMISATDEFKVLNLAAVPAMEPATADDYEAVITSDNPSAYWRMMADFDSWDWEIAGNPGPNLTPEPTSTSFAAHESAIVGENPAEKTSLAAEASAGAAWVTEQLAYGSGPDLSGASEFAVEFWFWTQDASPASDNLIMQGPQISGGGHQFQIGLSTAGVISGIFKNTAPATVTVTTSAILEGYWYHVAFVAEGGSLKAYLNRTLQDSDSWTAGASPLDDTLNTEFMVGSTTTTVVTAWDEVAVYRHALAAARVSAHYTAARSRGFPREQYAHLRVVAALDAISNHAPRSIAYSTSDRKLSGQFMHGQSPTDPVKDAVQAEAPDGMFFVAGDGTVTFLNHGHRGSAPYDTVQATFSDTGADHDYHDIQVDFSEAYLTNEWSVTTDAPGAETQTASDATSIARYFKRSQSLGPLKITDGDTVAGTIAADLLAKYKEPLQRVTGLEPKMAEPATAAAVLGLEIADRIRVIRGTLDEELFVQRIDMDGTPGVAPTVKLGVSPV